MSAVATAIALTAVGGAVASNAASKAQQGANSTNARIASDANEQNWNQYLLSRGINSGGLPGVAGGSVNTILPLGFTLNGLPAEQAIFNRILQTGGLMPSGAGGAGGGGIQTTEQLLGSEDALNTFFNSDPGYAAEYNRHMQAAAGTDRRSPTQWMRDFIVENPGSADTFQAYFLPAADANINDSTSLVNDHQEFALPPQYNKLLEYGPQTLDQLYGGNFLAQQQQAQDAINAARATEAATVQQAIDEQRLKFGQLNTGQLTDLDRILATRTTGSQGIYDASLLQADTYSNAVKQATADELQRQRAARALQGFVGEGSGDALLRARTLASGYQAAGGARAQAGVDQAGRLYNINDSDVTSRFNVNSDYMKALAQLLDANGAAANAGAQVNNATDNASVISNDIATRLASMNQPATLIGSRLQLENQASANKYSDINNLLSTLGFFRQNQPAAAGYVAPQVGSVIGGGGTLGAGLSAAGTGLSQYYQNQQLVNALKGLGTKTPAASTPGIGLYG